jgi:hypothetical protein
MRFAAIWIGLLVATTAAAQATAALRFIFPSNGQIIYGNNILLWVGGLPLDARGNSRVVVFEASTDKKGFSTIPQVTAPGRGAGSRTTALDSLLYPVGTLYLRARYVDEEAGPMVAVRVARGPVIGCLAAKERLSEEVVFDCSKSTMGTRSAGKFRWQFGDGSSASTKSPTVRHRYKQEGSFPVTVSLENSLGLTTAVRKLLLLTQDGATLKAPSGCGCEWMKLKTTGKSTLSDLRRRGPDGKLLTSPLGEDPKYASLNFEIEAKLLDDDKRVSDPSLCTEGQQVKETTTWGPPINGTTNHRACTVGKVDLKCNTDSDCDPKRACKGGVHDGKPCDDPGSAKACLVAGGICSGTGGGTCTQYPLGGPNRGDDDYKRDTPKDVGAKVHMPNVTWLDFPGLPDNPHKTVQTNFLFDADYYAFLEGSKGEQSCSCHFTVVIEWDNTAKKFGPKTKIDLKDPDPETKFCTKE